MTVTDLDLTVLNELDFEPPCSVVNVATPEGVKQKPCDRPAVWAVQFRGHCQKGKTPIHLYCEEHFAHLAAGGVWSCAQCNQPLRAIDFVIRQERIKP